MAGRPLATAGGRDHRCGHFRWRANSRRGIREGVRAWKEKWTGHMGKDGPWRGAGGQGGMEGRWRTIGVWGTQRWRDFIFDNNGDHSMQMTLP
jgi:hypothetical protein